MAVVDIRRNTVIKTLTSSDGIGDLPLGVAVTPDGTRAYIVNRNSDSVTVLNTRNNKVVQTLDSSDGIGDEPIDVAITPDGTRAYVTNQLSNSVTVIDTRDNSHLKTITNGIGGSPFGVAVGACPARSAEPDRSDDSTPGGHETRLDQRPGPLAGSAA